MRTEHRAALHAWHEEFGSQRDTDEAQEALREVRTEHWNDTQVLFGKYGIDAPNGPRAVGAAGGGCGWGGGSGGMMGGWSY